MKFPYLFSIVFLLGSFSYSQPLPARLQSALQKLQSQPSMRHALIGFCVADSKNGKIVFENLSQTGMAAASVQKLFTSIAAFELMGSNFRFKTQVNFEEQVSLPGNGVLYITGYGDPTLGSWRFAETRPRLFLAAIRDSLIAHSKKVHSIIIDDSQYPTDGIPRGWIWEDVGNYYGAGVWGINWQENQFDLALRPGTRKGDPATVAFFDSAWFGTGLRSSLWTEAAGTGDNAYLFPAINGNDAYLLGSIPAGKLFSISGAMQNPYRILAKDLLAYLDSCRLLKQDANHLTASWQHKTSATPVVRQAAEAGNWTMLTQYSPTLDSINYFFLRKSVNLYGEALLKAIAFRQAGLASTEKGVELLQDFWEQNGIDKEALHVTDGSGLSPLNRVTTSALVKALLFARKQAWFEYFYDALPTYNGMKMKSGSISGARAFAGYQTARNGKQYAFAIVVNNFSGSGEQAVKDLYKVLDELKHG